MAIEFKVNAGCAVIGKSGTLYRTGSIITDYNKEFGKVIEEHLANGFVTKINKSADELIRYADGLTIENGPGSSKQSVVLGKEIEKKDAITINSKKSNLDLDPKLLQDLNLEELNALVVEKTPTHVPFTSKRKAIAYLSRDF